MNRYTVILFAATLTFGLPACGDDGEEGDGASGVLWDETDPAYGELSGDLSMPTSVTLSVGDNVIVGGSVPGDTEECIQGPEGPPAPYYQGHTSYTDAITFTLPAGHTLTAITVEALTVEAVHTACDTPMEEQLGAFTALAASDQIDWDSDTFDNFVKLPEQHPLIGAGFAKTEGSDLLALYQAGFGFGPYAVDALAALPTDGTFTFWWKEGANRTEYQLNFVVSAE